MAESTAFVKKARRPSSSPPPTFSILPAIHKVIEEAPPPLLREAMKLMTQNSDEDASTVTLMLDQAQYNVDDLDDSDDGSSDTTIEYEGYIDSDPIADTLYKALLSRKAELEARNKREREERQAAMARSRRNKRNAQRTMDKAIELNHDRSQMMDEAAILRRTLHKMHKRNADEEAITKVTRTLRIKAHAAEKFKDQILALSDIPVRHVDCELCGKGFDANRNQLGDCQRHKGQRLFHWEHYFDVEDTKSQDQLPRLLDSISKDMVDCAHANNHTKCLPYTQWTCCNKAGDQPGCNHGKHQEKRV